MQPTDPLQYQFMEYTLTAVRKKSFLWTGQRSCDRPATGPALLSWGVLSSGCPLYPGTKTPCGGDNGLFPLKLSDKEGVASQEVT